MESIINDIDVLKFLGFTFATIFLLICFEFTDIIGKMGD